MTEIGCGRDSNEESDSMARGSRKCVTIHENNMGTLQQFAESSTIHGMNRIFGQRRGFVSRSLYSVVIIAVIGLLSTSLCELTSTVLKRKIITRTQITQHTALEFPAVTVCSHQIIFLRATVKESFCELHDGSGRQWFTSNQSMDSFLKEHSVDKRSFIISSSYDKEELSLDDWEETLHGSVPCYTFNGPKTIAKKRVPVRMAKSGITTSALRVVIQVPESKLEDDDLNVSGIVVYVSHHTVPNVFHAGIGIHPGTATAIALRKTKYSFLPKPYRSFQSADCVELDEIPDPEHSCHDLCRVKCLIQEVSRRCSCSTGLFGLDNLPHCTVGDVLTGCFAKTMAHLSAGNWTCHCQRRCQYIEYDVTISATQYPFHAIPEDNVYGSDIEVLRNKHLSLNIFFDSLLTREERHEPEMPLERLSAALGGHLGLCLGASVVSVVELVEFTIQVLRARFRRTRAEGYGS